MANNKTYTKKNFFILFAIILVLGIVFYLKHTSENTDYNSNITPSSYDPLKKGIDSKGKINNPEAVIPSQCYTKTNGVSNPCWTCHTTSVQPNHQQDFALQEEYSFSDLGLTNNWKNLFVDRSEEIQNISDEEVYEYIRVDNYTPLKESIESIEDYWWWAPDLDFDQGFDDEGFANDGSWWRAIRYKPFLGTFWPTNGNTDDVMIRLPKEFWQDDEYQESREIYKINLAILEAVITCEPGLPHEKCKRYVGPINEKIVGIDLNQDGELSEEIDTIVGIPERYVGAAKEAKLKRYVYPQGVEFLHTVRYVDPDSPTLMSKRMKELRYSKKVMYLDAWGLIYFYERESNDKDEARLPQFTGSPKVGLLNEFGWQLQGFIEDADGRLRLQTHEEHLYCMGCHSTIGATVDQTFTLARKVPGPEGWKHQDIRGIKDVPQVGHKEPEILTYFERVGGGDEFRSNDEVLDKFFPNGELDKKKVLTAAPGGEQDITYLIAPSRERALLLNKAYMALVRYQSFELGRDTVISPPENVHQQITNGSTGLKDSGQVYYDGRIWLDWDWSDPKILGSCQECD